jgi:hypothetical protein
MAGIGVTPRRSMAAENIRGATRAARQTGGSSLGSFFLGLSGVRGHRVKAGRRAVSLRPLGALDQDQRTRTVRPPHGRGRAGFERSWGVRTTDSTSTGWPSSYAICRTRPRTRPWHRQACRRLRMPGHRPGPRPPLAYTRTTHTADHLPAGSAVAVADRIVRCPARRSAAGAPLRPRGQGAGRNRPLALACCCVVMVRPEKDGPHAADTEA